jgi:hypothetical protein
VVPRAWAIYFAEMAGVEVPDALPESWIEGAEREAGYAVPSTLSEPPQPDMGTDPSVAQVVMKVKQLVFPRHGLSP